MSRTIVSVDALVVGAGPAGLAAAAALKEEGAGSVLVVDREDEAGGTPRLCEHSGFGLRDLRRVMSGPAYARRWVQRAAARGVDIRTGSMVTAWIGPGRAALTGPDGLSEIEARAVVLATGAVSGRARRAWSQGLGLRGSSRPVSSSSGCTASICPWEGEPSLWVRSTSLTLRS